MLTRLLRCWLESVPVVLLAYFVANVAYLSLSSIIPGVGLSEWQTNATQVGLFLLILLVMWTKARENFVLPDRPSSLLLGLLLPIIILRGVIGYPMYDDMAFHYMAGDYARNLWTSNNFMPMDWVNYFYPAIDMLYTPFLHLLGIRATIILFFILISVWYVSIFNRFLAVVKHDGRKKLLITILFMMTPFIPHLVGTHGTLMVDFFGLAISLETIYQFESKSKNKTFAGFMAVMMIMAKQSSAIFVAPIVGYYLFKYRRRIVWRRITIVTLASSIFFIRMFLESGNPLYGLYNGIFNSPLFIEGNFKNTLFGGKNWWEVLIWPAFGQFLGIRYGELVITNFARAFFSPIAIIGYFASVILMFYRRSMKYGVIVFSYLMWSVIAGYSRYVIPLNVIVVLSLILDLPAKSNFLKGKWTKNLLLGLIGILCFSSIKTDYSWRPYPSMVTKTANAYYWETYLEGSKYLFSDTMKNLVAEQQGSFGGYEKMAIIQRGPVTFYGYLGYLNGLEVVEVWPKKQVEKLLASKSVSSHIKNNMVNLHKANKVLMIVREDYEYMNTPELYIYDYFDCHLIDNAISSQYFQRSSANFGNIHRYECTNKANK